MSEDLKTKVIETIDSLIPKRQNSLDLRTTDMVYGIYMAKEAVLKLFNAESAEPGWIPTSERVPEVGTYIVTGKQKYDWEDKWDYFVDVAYCPGNYVDFFWDTFNDWDEGQETHIIAWMPLPEPWKGESDVRHEEKGD